MITSRHLKLSADTDMDLPTWIAERCDGYIL